MATTGEILYLIRQFADESDSSFFSDNDVTAAMEYGIRKFQNVCQSVNANVFVSEVTINPGGADHYDLADPANPVTIFGATIQPPGTQRCKSIIKLYTAARSTGWGGTVIWQDVQSIEQLLARRSVWTNIMPWRNGVYFLNGNDLMFTFNVAIPITIMYQSDKLYTGTGLNAYVDDLGQFADLIAMFALEPYEIRNGTANPVLSQRKQERMTALQLRMYQGRDINNGGRVNILP